MNSASDVAVKIIRAESLERLFDLTVGGIQVYQHLRLRLYYEITKQLGIFGSQYKPNIHNRIKNSLHYIKHAVLHNDLRGVTPQDIVVLEHPRKILLNGYYNDIYTTDLLEDFPHSFCIVKWPYQDEYYKNETSVTKNLIYYDYFALKRRLLTRLGRLRISECNFAAQKIETALRKNIASKINIQTIAKEGILNACYGVPIAIHFLKKVRPSLIIIVVSYGRSHFVHAAKELGIPVVELQHSIIYPYHLGYHYPHVKPGSIKAFPDYFFTFGEYWGTMADLPISQENIIATGFPFFETQKQQYAFAKRNRRQILFISQKVIGKQLFKIAVETAQKLPSYNIILKLHPKQYNSYEKELTDLTVNKPLNLQIVRENGHSLYQLFAESTWQVGVFSTAIYEGLAWGLNTIICDLPGWEYMKNLIEYGAARLAHETDEILQYITRKDGKKIDATHMFKPNAVKNMVSAVESIFIDRINSN
jgi:UDP-N-acetylglucosamine:LPS N-acetylglucosamine transferase